MRRDASNKNKKVANSLVAASSAAVLAVYSAGYVRTRSAAERFETQAAERRPAVQSPPRVAPPIAEVRPAAPEARADAPSRKAPAAIDHASDTPSQPNSTEPAETVSATAAPVPAAAPAIAPASEPATPEVAATAPAPAPAPAWKDGTYYGWGTSRHGDIQAQVVIEGGRIAAATISDCRTRYSCSVIEQLPPQVAQRQSPEVDRVSGATQSADAFYYAVVEALSKAK